MTAVEKPTATTSVIAPMPMSSRALLAFCVGAFVYLFFFFVGDNMLKDSDTFWQIKVGQWMLETHSVPHVDLYSFTKFQAPWISTSWLSQILYAVAFAQWGWAGPVILAALAIAAAAAILVFLLSAYIDGTRCILLTMLVLWLSISHFFARPHVLAMPVMVAWVGILIAAADRRAAPPLLLLPVMVLWTNLHGGFVLGLALIAPIALVAVWEATADQRIRLAMQWGAFAAAALVASCCSPYGWHTLRGAFGILDLGQLLTIIWEWRPADFSTFGVFEAALLGLFALAFHRGMVLSAPRILLLLGLVHIGLSHVRSIEVFAFLLPMVLARPLAEQVWPTVEEPAATTRSRCYNQRLAAFAVFAATLASTIFHMSVHTYAFARSHVPEAAVELLKQRGAKRIFNAYQFGGYMISAGMPVFIDGRAELYGEQFVLNFFDAVEGRKLDQLLRLLDDNQIEATLLSPTVPAAQFLDHLSGWQRLYADDVAVIHIRVPNVKP